MLNVRVASTRVETVIGVLLLFIVTQLILVAAEDDTQRGESRGVLLNALTFGAGGLSVNVSIDGCVWRKSQVVVGSAAGSGSGSGSGSASGSAGEGDVCPDPAIKFYLYTSLGSPRREIDARNPTSALASAGWVQQHHTVILIHGYGGGDNTIPISILRDAYLSRGDFNVIMVDWGGLSAIPCYPAAVHNSAHVGRCAALIPRMLRDAGANADAWTCVGHSLGAHVCGAISDHLSFRVHKIIGLDPARPLVRPTSRFRLDSSDASVVHVLHTDAGHYGETGRLGTVDFCVNGGRTQPHCRLAAKGEHLCNHISAVCFLAESLDPTSALTAEPCSRRCLAVRLRPGLIRDDFQHGGPIRMGFHSPDSASGTYCASSVHQPYCPRKPGDRGHPKCCVDATNSNAKPEKQPSDAPGFVNDLAEPSPMPAPTREASSRSESLAANLTDNIVPDPVPASGTTPIATESIPEEPSPTPISTPTPTVAMNRVSDDNDSGIVLVLPSTEIDLPSSLSTIPSPKEEEPVFPVYSTMADTASGPVLVVMATPMKNTSAPHENAIGVLTDLKEVTKRPRPRPFSPQFSQNSNSFPSSQNSFLSSPSPFSPSPSSFPSSTSAFSSSTNSFTPLNANSFPGPTNSMPTSHKAHPTSSSSFPMFAMEPSPSMTDMVPPNPNPTQSISFPNPMPMAIPMEVPMGIPAPAVEMPFTSADVSSVTVPMSPPPPNGGIPIPGAPDDGDAPIPMAGSLTGPWVPMVMLPPTPFSTDSWKVWSSSKTMALALAPVRRSTFRNYIYE